MTTNTFGDVPPLRRRLASRLSELRRASGLPSISLAGAIGHSQSTVSRIENAGQVPSRATVERWCAAVDADPKLAAELLELADAVSTEVVEWRRATRHGYTRLQHDMRAVEAEATVILKYSPLLVPGLLQTADVARTVIESFGLGQTDVTEAVAARLERQAVLLDGRKRFEFVLAEPVLRWRLGPRRLMVAQLERILQVAALPHVELGVIAETREMSSWPGHAFTIYQAAVPMVLVETLTTGLTVTEPDAIRIYDETFARLAEAAARGQEAVDLVEAAIANLG